MTDLLQSPAPSSAALAFDRLLAIMARLRDPQDGCPWDLEQSFRTIVPHTIEEAYEVADAIERDDLKSLPGELGDLLFQVVFYAQMAAEAGQFRMEDVIAAINTKMIERHPHVFGTATIETAAAQTVAWEVQKAKERAAEAAAAGRALSVLDGVAAGLPALIRAEKLQKRAARIGFDWPAAGPVIDKVEEEIGELKAELGDRPKPERLDEEMGDLLFACANLARHLGVDPEGALRRANAKFERRFKRMEALAAVDSGSGGGQESMPTSLEHLEALWQRVKAEEGKHAP
ncbi:nucleoside triphosphate pyrophosphohydrolase [Dongia sedimenti]|uniref:Nucleoside triphosphate pyrophosphohydrolase n=1 Tax=Dongia sedimenti TaxID=3064282 RepID=A0ABU0YLB9_9PROT|nr:nucleoside triphosphate pyrophosphohydrolase [Rhodospirillaceae bacterium R-7]